MLSVAGMAAQAADVLRCFPVGPIYEYRWKLLQLVLEHTRDGGPPVRLQPYPEEVTQNRALALLETGQLDVLALGTNQEREARLMPVRIDILKGIVGFRVLIIRADDQARITRMDDDTFRRKLTFGLNSQWADLPIMRRNGYAVETSDNYENLFAMLAERRFDAFPRGLNEAKREVDARRTQYPQLAVERTKAVFFPYPIYFWVRKDNPELAARIKRGLELSLADGSFRRLFEHYHASEIAALKKSPRHVIRLDNPVLPAGDAVPDTSWWYVPPKRKS